MSNFWPGTARIGGGTGALDSIDGDDLVDGDVGFVMESDGMRFYRLNATSGATEDGLRVIAPDTNPGDKRWILQAPLNQPFENLIDNPFEVISNLDSNGGEGTMTYDSGSEEPSPGDQLDGATSSASGKVISVTLASGSWAGADAAGTIALGACSGRFHDNEDIDINGGTANVLTVNMPDSAVGVDLLQNGDFSVDTDPPPGWSGNSTTTISTEGLGKITNCLRILENSAANPYAYSAVTVIPGELYRLVGYVKAGDEATWRIQLYDVTNAADIKTTASLEESAGDWSTSFDETVRAPDGCVSMQVRLQQMCSSGAGTFIYFDEVSLWHLRPCTTDATADTFDGWGRSASDIDVYRITTNDVTLPGGAHYGAMLVPSGAAKNITALYGERTKDYHIHRFEGRTITSGLWVKTSTASHVRLATYDGSLHYGSYHTGGGDWEWLELTYTFSTGLSNVQPFAVYLTQSSGIVYICQPMLANCDGLGEGNFSYPNERMVYLEKGALSNTLVENGLSDVAATTLKVDVDSKGVIPSGAKALIVYATTKDSGSGGNDTYLLLGEDLSDNAFGFVSSPTGLANDQKMRSSGLVQCNAAGDIEYQVEASGAGTFDITTFRYVAVQLR